MKSSGESNQSQDWNLGRDEGRKEGSGWLKKLLNSFWCNSPKLEWIGQRKIVTTDVNVYLFYGFFWWLYHHIHSFVHSCCCCCWWWRWWWWCWFSLRGKRAKRLLVFITFQDGNYWNLDLRKKKEKQKFPRQNYLNDEYITTQQQARCVVFRELVRVVTVCVCGDRSVATFRMIDGLQDPRHIVWDARIDTRKLRIRTTMPEWN